MRGIWFALVVIAPAADASIARTPDGARTPARTPGGARTPPNPREPGCEILDHGIYVPHSPRVRYDDSASVTGDRYVLDEVTFSTQTKTIALVPHNRFGIRYRLHDVPKDRPVDVTWHISFPKPGIRGHEGWVHSFVESVPAGEVVEFLLYDFDNDWEMVAGTWNFQVAIDGKPACSFAFEAK